MGQTSHDEGEEHTTEKSRQGSPLAVKSKNRTSYNCFHLKHRGPAMVVTLEGRVVSAAACRLSSEPAWPAVSSSTARMSHSELCQPHVRKSSNQIMREQVAEANQSTQLY